MERPFVLLAVPEEHFQLMLVREGVMFAGAMPRLRVTYRRDGVSFTFDLQQRRLEISFGKVGTLELVDAAKKFQLGNTQDSPMLAPARKRPRDRQ